MTQELSLLRQIGELDERYVQFADLPCPSSQGIRCVKWKWAVLAACLALLLAGCVGAMTVYLPSKEPLSLPEQDFQTFDNQAAYARIEFEGRVYSYYQQVSSRVLVLGERLGEAVFSGVTTEYITDPDTHQHTVDYKIESSTIAVFAVKGIDHRFMISTTHGQVFLCDNDISLKSGAEIYEARLRLRERYDRLEHYAYVDTQSERVVIDKEHYEEFERFLEALCQGRCVTCENVPTTDSTGVIVMLDNGLEIRLALYEGGYVRFTGLDVAVLMDEEICEQFRQLLRSLKGSPWKTVTYPDWDAIKAEMDKKKE